MFYYYTGDLEFTFDLFVLPHLGVFHQLELAPAPESFPTTGRNLKQPKVLLFSPYSAICLKMDIPCNLFGGLVPDITGTNEEVEKIVDTIGIREMS